MSQYERGYAAMLELLPDIDVTIQSDSNEADTRFQVIDRLLVDVLGWPRQAVKTERHTETGYIDYLVGSAGSQFVVEAKRTGRYFELPVGNGSSVVPIKSLTSGSAEGKELHKALEQAARYAQERGVSVACVFNGHQLVAFLASRTDGLAPLDGRAMIFPSAETMYDDFLVLWNHLSPDGVAGRGLHKLLQTGMPLPPEPLSYRLADYPGNQRRNQLQTSLQIMGELFLGDLEDSKELHEEFLRTCYATSGALSQYAEVSRQILASRYELLESLAPGSTTEASRKGEIASGLTADVMQAALSNRPIILLGDVGSGKSTFIDRLVNVDAKDVLGDSLSIYVDFGAGANFNTLNEHVLESCVAQLRDKYDINVLAASFAENVLRRELKYFDESPAGAYKTLDAARYAVARVEFLQGEMADRSAYLGKAFDWLNRSWHRQVVIFLDNVDQRDPQDQNSVFLISNELAQTWPATVFVSLRPETFYASQRDGAISGYYPRVFTISPPRADVMLKRRIDFALDQLRDTGRLRSFPANVSIDSESLELFLQVLRDNLGSNAMFIRMIDNMAGGNMRLALRFVTDFIGSGHVDTQKIIDIQRRFGSYTIPEHEFLRSLMFGDNRYYSPDFSPVPNLWRVARKDPKEHFLLPILLAFVQKTGEVDAEHGYVAAEGVYENIQSLGFEATQITDAIDYAVQFRLLESSRRYGRLAHEEVFRITTSGAYAYRVLAKRFTYLDGVTVDIPVLDDDLRRRVVDVWQLPDRLARAELMVDYLDSEWSYVPSTPAFDWATYSGDLRADIAKVRERSS